MCWRARHLSPVAFRYSFMEGTPLSYSKAANRKGHITLTLALTRMPTGLWRQHFYSNWTCDKVCSPGPYFSLTCAAFCSLKSVLNFGFGLRPWSSPPAVALANFLLNWLKARKSTQLFYSCFKLLRVLASKTSLASSISLQFHGRHSFELFKPEPSQRLGKRN